MTQHDTKPANERKALGRGLAALLGNPAQEEAPALKAQVTQKVSSLQDHQITQKDAFARVEEIELSKIAANPDQPRKQFNQARLEELALSLKEHGLVQPILVRPKSEGRFEIVAGE